MPDASPTQQLVDIKLGGGLDEFVTTRRAAGLSWRLVARELWIRTGIDITYETLRSWYPQDRAAS